MGRLTEAAALAIQCQVRRRKADRTAGKIRHAVMKVQTVIRVVNAMRKATVLREIAKARSDAAAKMQSVVRMHLCLLAIRRRRIAAAVTIQCRVRVFQACCATWDRYHALILVQTVARCILAKKAARLRLLEKKRIEAAKLAGSILLQSHARSFLVRCHINNLNNKAAKIQGLLAMLKAREQVEELRAARLRFQSTRAIKIQRIARGQLARYALEELRTLQIERVDHATDAVHQLSKAMYAKDAMQSLQSERLAAAKSGSLNLRNRRDEGPLTSFMTGAESWLQRIVLVVGIFVMVTQIVQPSAASTSSPILKPGYFSLPRSGSVNVSASISSMQNSIESSFATFVEKMSSMTRPTEVQVKPKRRSRSRATRATPGTRIRAAHIQASLFSDGDMGLGRWDKSL